MTPCTSMQVQGARNEHECLSVIATMWRPDGAATVGTSAAESAATVGTTPTATAATVGTNAAATAATVGTTATGSAAAGTVGTTDGVSAAGGGAGKREELLRDRVASLPTQAAHLCALYPCFAAPQNVRPLHLLCSPSNCAAPQTVCFWPLLCSPPTLGVHFPLLCPQLARNRYGQRERETDEETEREREREREREARREREGQISRSSPRLQQCQKHLPCACRENLQRRSQLLPAGVLLIESLRCKNSRACREDLQRRSEPPSAAQLAACC